MKARMTDADFVYGLIAAIPLIVALALFEPRVLLILGVMVAWALWVSAVFYIGRRLWKRRADNGPTEPR